jgi:hypothetical protein
LAREGKQRGWWSRYADIVSGAYATYIGFESEATELRDYETLWIPGLLQTEEYARALFSGDHPKPSPELIERKVAVRMTRQGVLTQSRPPRLVALLDESILHRSLGGPEVMRAQLKRLVDASQLPNVTLQIVPFDAGPHAGMGGSFTLVRFALPDDPDIVYLEGPSRGPFVEAEEALWYRDVFEHLTASALSPLQTRERIERFLD